MGYKRMKKTKYRVSKGERFQMRLAHKFTRVPFYEHPDLWRIGDWLRWGKLASKPTNYSFDQNTGEITLFGNNAEAMKWFESPNASGYLDM